MQQLVSTGAARAVRPIVDRRPCVLVVDEHVESRRSMEHALVQAGCSVLEASSGQDALKLLARMSKLHAPVDLVVCELQMSVVEELAALVELQHHRGSPPLILVTADDRRYVYRQAMRLGAAAVLRKPFELAQLVLAVRGRLLLH